MVPPVGILADAGADLERIAPRNLRQAIDVTGLVGRRGREASGGVGRSLRRQERRGLGDALPNGLELSCPAEAGKLPRIVARPGGPGIPHYPPARRVSFSELLGSHVLML